MSGLTSTDLQSSDILAVRNATAISMKTNIGFISYVGARYGTVSSSSKSAFRSMSTAPVIVTTDAAIPLSSTTFTSADQLYQSAVNNLNTAVSSGAYTNTLQAAAQVAGASVVSSATATGVSNSAPVITYPPPANDDSNDKLSDGAIAGIVIGTVLGVALLFGLVYYLYLHRDALPLASDRTNKEIDIIL